MRYVVAAIVVAVLFFFWNFAIGVWVSEGQLWGEVAVACVALATGSAYALWKR